MILPLILIAQATATVHPFGAVPRYCDAAQVCQEMPAAWTSLKPDARGRYVVFENGRWRWHSLKEFFERD